MPKSTESASEPGKGEILAVGTFDENGMPVGWLIRGNAALNITDEGGLLQSAFKKLKWAAEKPTRFAERKQRICLHRSPGLTGPEAAALWNLLKQLEGDMASGRLMELSLQ